MKKNRTMKVAALLLALTLMTSCFVGGTFAKYTSNAAGNDTATIAKWSFDVEGSNIATSTTFDMDLFAMPNTNVKQENGLVAPGTSGEFELNLTNTSDVVASYNITLSGVASNLVGTAAEGYDWPLQFKLGDGEWKDDISDLTITTANLAVGGTTSFTIQWKWVPASDEADTALGIASNTSALTYQVTASVEVNQVVS